MSKQRRIGMYAGTFDPVHSGHIAFALQATERAGLDAVYFLPERRPRQKSGVEHFGHRVAMLRRAVRPYPALDVLELDDVSFSVARTFSRLRERLSGDQLVFLFGSDVVPKLSEWPHLERLLRASELVIGCRAPDNPAALRRAIAGWPVTPQACTIFNSYAPEISSGVIRSALRQHQPVRGLLRSVERYSDQNRLYVALD